VVDWSWRREHGGWWGVQDHVRHAFQDGENPFQVALSRQETMTADDLRSSGLGFHLSFVGEIEVYINQ
jgi:hypothetical protein